jgi:hypothetical protein
MKDKEVQDKMEGLDALAGGIVYGKEEAWDKLQARLEQKPAKKIALVYRWLAAAAVLLLCLGIIGMYYYPEQQIAVYQPHNPVITTDTEHMAVATPITTEPILVTEPQTKAPANRKDVPHVQFVTDEPKTVKVPEPVDTAAAPAIAVTTLPKPQVTPVKKMRVVHINDLGQTEETEPQPAIVYNGPSLDISKMKVVSIYDVQWEENRKRQEEEIMTIVRLNRPHNGLFQFPGTAGRNNRNDQSFAQNPFSIRLNRNN